jgi:hypothetical protein
VKGEKKSAAASSPVPVSIDASTMREMFKKGFPKLKKWLPDIYQT